MIEWSAHVTPSGHSRPRSLSLNRQDNPITLVLSCAWQGIAKEPCLILCVAMLFPCWPSYQAYPDLGSQAKKSARVRVRAGL